MENKKAIIIDIENSTSHSISDDFEKIFNLLNTYSKILIVLSHDTKKFKLNITQILKVNNLISSSKLEFYQLKLINSFD